MEYTKESYIKEWEENNYIIADDLKTRMLEQLRFSEIVAKLDEMSEWQEVGGYAKCERCYQTRF